MIDRARIVGSLALGASIVLSAAGQLCLKAGMQKMHAAAADHLLESVGSLVEPAIGWLSIGFGAYALSLASWLIVLVRYHLSFAYPFLGLSYVLVYIGATQWGELAEPVTPLRTLGTLFVIAGVALLSFTGPRR